MEKYQNILVIIDPTTNDQIALKRAIELAKRTNSKLTAFLSIFDFSYEMTTILSSNEREIMRTTVIADRKSWVEEIVAEHNPEHLTIESRVLWHNRPFEAIINQVIDYKFDLVIKGTHQHDKFKAVIFTPTDWHILRKCPCPVLLVKEHNWPENGNILAAVNIGSDEEEHQSLNKIITDEANNLAQIINANVHLVNSFPGTPVNIAIEIPEFNAQEYNETMLKNHQKLMTEHTEKFNIKAENTYVREGLAEDVINDVASEIDAELVVLGTIGRTGFSAAIIGNTAEHVIDQLKCDVLALKPLGYKSPLEE
ncbi:MAG: universal stress protein UspE [Alteromonadaceae bacterium]|nr:universal stress protein UspE [Alteromonadaceae bacterium]